MFRPVERLADRQPESFEDRCGRDGNAGIDQNRREGGKIEDRADGFARARHHPGAWIEANRYIGTRGPRRRHDCGVVQGQAVPFRQQPQGCSGVRGAASDTGCHRQFLVQMEGPGRQTR